MTFRSPLQTKIERTHSSVALWSQSAVWQDLLCTLLATAAVAAPFIPTVSHNPIQRPNLTAVYAQASGVIPQAQPFFNVDSFVYRSPDRRHGFEKGAAVLPTPGPVAQYDWPNPATPRRSRDGFEQQAATLPTPGPTVQYDWPNPQAPRRLSTGFEYSNINQITAVVSPPFYALDFPNPARPRVANPSFELGTSLSLRLAPVAIPFVQYDWPNILYPRKQVFGFDAPAPLPLLSVSFVQPFFNQDSFVYRALDR